MYLLYSTALNGACAFAAEVVSPRRKKQVNAFELLGSAMDISNLFEVPFTDGLSRMGEPGCHAPGVSLPRSRV